MTQVAEPAERAPATPLSPPRGRLVSIDVLRGLAALAVLLYHIRRHPEGDAGSAMYYLTLPLEFGPLGVVLFIVISGFCIHLGTAKSIARGGAVRANWRAFWWRRTYRLYPPYLAAIALSLGIYYAVNPGDRSGFERIQYLPLDIVTHLLMIHNLFVEYIYGLGNGSFWSLGLEEQLYALFAVLLILRRRMSVVRTLYIALAVTLAWKLAVFALHWYLSHRVPEWFALHSVSEPPGSPNELVLGVEPLLLGKWMDGWPFSFWFAWVLGAVAAESYAGVLQLPDWCSRYRVAFVCAALSILFDWNHVSGPLLQSDWLRSSAASKVLNPAFGLATMLSSPLFALASFVLINAWVKVELQGQFQAWWVAPIARVGLMSYSLYLVHTPLLRLAENLLPLEFTPFDVLLRFVLFVPLCLGFAALFFILIERRFLVPPGKGEGAKG